MIIMMVTIGNLIPLVVANCIIICHVLIGKSAFKVPLFPPRLTATGSDGGDYDGGDGHDAVVVMVVIMVFSCKFYLLQFSPYNPHISEIARAGRLKQYKMGGIWTSCPVCWA
jgi:hypothetical protein